MTDDETFLEETTHLAQLVARGDIAAFEVDGRVDITPIGRERFTTTVVVLAHAAYAHRRRVLLRWRGDPAGSEAAKRRNGANVSQLVEGIQDAYARIEQYGASAPTLVGIELLAMGPMPPAMAEALQRLCVMGGPFPLTPASPGAALGPAVTETGAPLLLAWDSGDHQNPYVCTYRVGPNGAQLVEAKAVRPGDQTNVLAEWQRAGGRVGATVGRTIVWAFDETGEVWTPNACKATGPRSCWRIGRNGFDVSGCRAVVSFYDKDDYGHRGVRFRQTSGSEFLVIDEHDSTAQLDPTYGLDNLAIDGAWASALGRDLAAWLATTHEDGLP
jgi:hypothetical protein